MSVQYKIPDYVHLSKECRHLLSRIFVPNSTRRITIKEIKTHPWFLKNLPKELRETAQAIYYKAEDPSFSLQSVEEIMKIVDEGRKPLPTSNPVPGFEGLTIEDGDDEDEYADEGELEEEEDDDEDEYEKKVKQVHASGEFHIN